MSGIAFIGGGRMAEAMIQSLLRQRRIEPRQITVCDVVPERLRELGGTYGVRTFGDAVDAVAGAATVVLAIKPQQLGTALAPLRGILARDVLLLSIVAGARAAWICEAVQHDRLVRAMPNIPAQVGMSATVWWATPETSPELRERARTVLGAIGLELGVHSEREVEIATGLTGPTPAFVFLIIEALVEAGVGLGFGRDAALALTLQTIEGSVGLMRETGAHAAVLRGHVTSPGGATAAGLYTLEKAALRATLIDAVRAVFDRSCALGAEIEKTSRDHEGAT